MINLLLILIILVGLLSFGEDKQNRLEKEIHFNSGIHYMRTSYPDSSSLYFRRIFENIFNDRFPRAEASKEPYSRPPLIITDKIKVPETGHKNKSRVNLTFLYDIKDDFPGISPIFKVGNNIFFLLEGAVKKKDVRYYGIYKINEENWYEFITGTRFDFAADLGNNRVLGYLITEPLKLYGFKENFRGEFYIKLPDFRYRQELYRLSYDKFLFHNFRFNHFDYAVEIYGINGKRIREYFNYVPYNFKQVHRLPIATQTVLTTDKKGHFYIAFQYPLNPYRIWKYDDKGRKLRVFGNYFTHADVYESPEDWVRFSLKEINRFGVRRFYTIHKLLTDSQGRLLVFFSENRIKKWALGGQVAPKYFLDIYSQDGDFIGRKKFNYGFADLLDKGIIYSRRKIDRESWEITAVRLTIK